MKRTVESTSSHELVITNEELIEILSREFGVPENGAEAFGCMVDENGSASYLGPRLDLSCIGLLVRWKEQGGAT